MSFSPLGTILGIKKNFFLAMLLGLLLSFPSQAAIRTGLLWGPTYNMPFPSTNRGGTALFGGGATLELGLLWNLGLEVGAFYQPIALNRVTTDTIAAPASLRFWFGHKVTFSVGAYAGYQYTKRPSSIAPLGYGIRATAGLNLPIGPLTCFVLEIGGQFQLSNMSTIGGTFNQNQLLALVGFRFGEAQSKKYLRYFTNDDKRRGAFSSYR